MKKKELTLQDIFNQNNKLCKKIIDCLQNITAKIDGLQIEYNTVKSIEVHNGVMITDKDYITITADDVLVGDESVREYNGEKIYNYYHLPAYFKEIRDDVAEKGIKLLEIHCLQSPTDGEYAKTGNPTPDKNGCYAWCRCVWEKDGEKHIGAWVFFYTYSSAANCAYYCAFYCAHSVRNSASCRSAVFGGLD
ncbi:MAG: hypothetical protein II843_01440 [Alphaproteobacteria bacterium]|nr:hypothetical protein [Alphaproteobacteria bacterium]